MLYNELESTFGALILERGFLSLPACSFII